MAIPDPVFITTDPTTVETEIVSAWEAIAGKTLFPGQAERLLINLAAYREALLRVGIQYAGEQNLVNFATGANLDQLGALVGAPRLAAAAAQCTIQFTLGTIRGVDTLIPSGTRVRVPGAQVLFATDENVTIDAGDLVASVAATATITGTQGNGFAIASITELVDAIAGLSLTPSNTDATSGGSDIESDDAYRERIKLAPSQFSTAGPADAYEFHTRSVSPTIIDAAVLMPFNEAGGLQRIYVDVYFLTDTGIPSSPLIATVQDALDDDQVRPLNDIVTVKAPTEVNYTITAAIVLLTSANIAETTAAITTAVNAYIADRKSKLGQDIIVSQIIGAIASISGVYSVTVSSPSANIIVSASQWANHTGTLTLNITGTNEG